ncbi:MAG: phosphogluconate dehydratase [Candidatus Competibacterales bacterium]
MADLHPTLCAVTDRIRARSAPTRRAYLARLDQAKDRGPLRKALSCTNQAHAFAAAPDDDKNWLKLFERPNIAIVSAYNDMLSAHQPLETFPARLKAAARQAGAVAQFAGGVPAMCDGVTQGQDGMELSLFSRDVIAMATAVALSHNTFDAVLCLGVCDKIVPGLLMGALTFGHLPVIFVPAGPMTTGIPNAEKARIRQQFAKGEIGREELLEAELKSYHGPGTCTFYGTANSNQMLMEIMGLHIPGSAFINPNTPLRDALTDAAATRIVAITAQGDEYLPMGRIVDARAIVNAMVGLHATGGSTNHTIHLVAIARAAGIAIDWDDFSELSAAVPLLTKVYPNGQADVNQFHAAGGLGLVIGELLDAGLLHGDVLTVMGQGLDAYRREPFLDGDQLAWRPAPRQSLDPAIVASRETPFAADGGLKLLTGNLGRAVVKTSAVKPQHRVVEAKARVFDDQAQVIQAFKAGELNRDVVVVVRFQGPRANGMPELHQLMPSLGVLQDQGHSVALVTDGRMSGASGKVLAAIHTIPECLEGGPLARVRDDDMVRVDGETGQLQALVDEAEWRRRTPPVPDLSHHQQGLGRELFGAFRATVDHAEAGAVACGLVPLSALTPQVQEIA